MAGSQAVAAEPCCIRDREGGWGHCEGQRCKGRDRRPAACEHEHPGSRESDEEDERCAAASGRAAECVQHGWSRGGAALEVLACLGGIPLREPQVGEYEREREHSDYEDRQGRPELPAAPEPERNSRLRAEQKRAEGMNGQRQQCGCRGGEGRTTLRLRERAHEEVGRERAREREERVHPPERPVDQQQL